MEFFIVFAFLILYLNFARWSYSRYVRGIREIAEVPEEYRDSKRRSMDLFLIGIVVVLGAGAVLIAVQAVPAVLSLTDMG